MSSVRRVVEVRPKNTTISILKNLLKKKARKQKIFNLIMTMLMTMTSKIMTVFK